VKSGFAYTTEGESGQESATEFESESGCFGNELLEGWLCHLYEAAVGAALEPRTALARESPAGGSGIPGPDRSF
jgi:hypothetical protein